MTGVSGDRLSDDSMLFVGEHSLTFARTFSEVQQNNCFWYKNSIGLAEISANKASAANIMDISVGDSIKLRKQP